ncbi:hypothetical protein [Pedobacter arcticus]|uniref:hypothetical protein n=1 Tax=Pedobacter arcticus TaxID=752140 RepID=UPI00037ED39E|nr:hypothetical protein [Pedobacter arcticus]
MRKILALLIALSLSVVAGCKSSRNMQLSKVSTEMKATSTENVQLKAETTSQKKTVLLSDETGQLVAVLTNFSGKINPDGSVEGTAESVGLNAKSRKQKAKSEDTNTSTKKDSTGLKNNKTAFKQDLKDKETHTVRNGLPWWVWLIGLVALMATVLLFNPKQIFQKLKTAYYEFRGQKKSGV